MSLRERFHALRRRIADRIRDRIAGEPKKPAKPHGWPRRILKWTGRIVLGLLVLLVAARIALPFVLPAILSHVAQSKGFTCGYERLDLSLLAGEVRLQNLAITDMSIGEPIASLGYAEVDIHPLELLRGRLHARRIEVSGLDLLIDRDREGHFALLEKLGAGAGAAAATATAKAATPQTPSESGSLAIILDQVTIDHIDVHLRDASVTPAVDAHLSLHALVSDVDTTGAERPRPGRVSISVRCPPFLDALIVEATLRTHGHDSNASIDVSLDRLHPGPAAGYLGPLGIRTKASDISAGLSFSARTHAALDDPEGLAGDLALDSVRVTADDVEAAAIDHIGLDLRCLSSKRVDVARAVVQGVRASAERLADGGIRAAGLEIGEAPGAATVTAVAVAAPAQTPSGGPKRIVLSRFEIADVRLALHDASVTPSADVALGLRTGSIDALVIDETTPGIAAALGLEVEVPGIAERIVVTGTATPTGGRRSVDAGLRVEGITARAIAPYLAKAGIAPTLEAGTFGAHLEAVVRESSGGAMAIDAALRDVAFSDGSQEFAGLDAARISGALVDSASGKVEVTEVAIVRPRIAARRDAAGALHVLGLAISPKPPVAPPAKPTKAKAGSWSERAEPEPAREPEPGSTGPRSGGPGGPPLPNSEAKPIRAHLARLSLDKAAFHFIDESVSPTALIAIENTGFELLDVVADTRPGAAAPAPAKLRAWLEVPGIVERIEASGELVASPSAPSIELRITGRGVEPRALDPYLAASGVKRELAEGELEIVLGARATIAPGGGLRASAGIERLRLVDVGGERIIVEGARVHGIDVSADGKRIDVERIELERAHLAATIDEKGQAGVLGFRVLVNRPPPKPTATPQYAASPAGGLPAPIPPPGAATLPPPGAPVPEAEVPTPTPLPRFSLGAVHVGEIGLDLADASKLPVADTAVRVAADAGPIVFDGSGREPPAGAPLHVRVSVPGMLEALGIDGTVAIGPRGGKTALEVAARGISFERARDALAAAGLEPAMQAGGLHFSVSGEAEVGPRATSAAARIERLAVMDGERELVGLDALRVEDVVVGPTRVDVGAVSLARPRIAAWREADGSILAAGVRVPTKPPVPKADLLAERGPMGTTTTSAPATARGPERGRVAEHFAQGAEQATQGGDEPGSLHVERVPGGSGSGAVQPTAPAPSPPPAKPPAPPGPVIALHRFAITGAHAALYDAIAFPGSLDPVTMNADVTLGTLLVGVAAQPATFDAEIAVPGALDRFAVTGAIDASPALQRVDLQVALEGLRAGRLASYLPPGTSAKLNAGVVRAGIHAKVAPLPSGGKNADLLVNDIDFRDGDSKQPHFHIDIVHLAAPNIDMAGGHVTITAIAVTGIEAHVRRGKNGALEIMGLQVEPPTETAIVAGGEVVSGTAVVTGTARPSPAGVVAGAAGASAASAAGSVAAGAPQPGGETADQHARAARRARLPLIDLDGLHINVREVSIEDLGRPGAPTVRLHDLNLRNVTRWRVLGADPGASTPIDLRLEAAVAPLVRGVTITARVAPFALDPDMAVTATAIGLHGAEIPILSPALAQKIDGSTLVNGRFAVSAEAVLTTRRHDPLDFDLVHRRLGLDFEVKGLDVRDGQGKVLLGLGDLHLDVSRMSPLTGETRIRDLTIQRPAGHVWQDHDGLHIAGIVLKAPTGTAAPTVTAVPEPPPPKQEDDKDAAAATTVAQNDQAAAAAEARTSAAEAEAKAKATAQAAAMPEVRIDRLSISDVDFTYEDRTVDPPMVIPLDEAEVDVRGFTTMALSSRHSVRFTAVLRAGNVRLPTYDAEAQTSFVGSLVGKLGEMTHITKKKSDYEMRPLFREIAVRGELAIAPNPFGSIEAQVDGLELAGFAGMAKKAQVNLGGGLVDVQATAQFSPEGALSLRTRTDLTGLDVSEARGGPISRVLGLGAPLDAVVFALRDENGDIVIPFNKDFPPNQIGGGKVAGALVKTIGIMVADAFKNMGFRAISEVVDIGKDVLSFVPGVGALGFLSSEPVTVTPVVIRFPAGDTEGAASQMAELDDLVQMYNDDKLIVVTIKHDVGAADLARARVSANPGPTDRLDVISELMTRRDRLLRRRADLIAEARASFAAGLIDHGEASVTATANIDRALVTVMKSLDSVYDLEREGAERMSDRRARAACIDLANARIAVIEDALVARGVSTSERVRVARARVEDNLAPGGGTVTVSITRRKRKGVSMGE